MRDFLDSHKNMISHHHYFADKHIMFLINKIKDAEIQESKRIYNDAINKMNGYFMLAKRFPRVHENTPKFIYNTEKELTEYELNILFFAGAIQPVYDATSSDEDD